MQIKFLENPRTAGDLIFTSVENGNASDPLVAGDVVEYELAATALVPGRSVVDGTVDDPLVAGVIIGKTFGGENVPAGDFGLMQVGGCNVGVITTDGSVAAGNVLLAAASAVAKGSASDAIGRFGVALAADSSTTLAANSAIIRGLI